MESKICPDCGRTTQADAPGILATEQGSAVYGPELRAFGVYLSQGQLLPYDRTCGLIEDLFGHKISVGTLAGWIHKASVGLFATVENVADALAGDSGSVHFDETGVPCEKKNQWLHSASNDQLTYFAFHPKRGNEAMDDIGILPRFEGTAIHDRWSAYMKYGNCRHGLCGSHLLRDLRFAWEHEGEPVLEVSPVQSISAEFEGTFRPRKNKVKVYWTLSKAYSTGQSGNPPLAS
jgi:transposase